MRILEKVNWIFMGVFIALIIMEIVREQFLIANISFQLTQISDLRQQNEQLLEEYSSLQADFMEVNQQIKELETTNKKLTEQLVNQKREVAECYAEMDFSSIYNWNRELFQEEIDLVENAKYYIIDNQTMLCVSKNNGGKVYVLERFAY